jgi:hypothetical protein
MRDESCKRIVTTCPFGKIQHGFFNLKLNIRCKAEISALANQSSFARRYAQINSLEINFMRTCSIFLPQLKPVQDKMSSYSIGKHASYSIHINSNTIVADTSVESCPLPATVNSSASTTAAATKPKVRTSFLY